MAKLTAVVGFNKDLSERQIRDRLLDYWVPRWQFLGIENPDFEDLYVPPLFEGMERSILTPKGVGPQRVFDALNEKVCPCHDYSASLDGVRNVEGDARFAPRAIWIRDSQEGDEYLQAVSAGEIWWRSLKTANITDCLVNHSAYSYDKGAHPDSKYWTLCPSSRCCDDYDVPFVYWHDGELGIFRCSPGCRDEHLRSRQIAS